MKLTNDQKDIVKAAAIFAGTAVYIGCLIVESRRQKRETEAFVESQVNRRIRFANAIERLEMVGDDLDARIAIARQCLTDDEFRRMTKDLGIEGI